MLLSHYSFLTHSSLYLKRHDGGNGRAPEASNGYIKWQGGLYRPEAPLVHAEIPLGRRVSPMKTMRRGVVQSAGVVSQCHISPDGLVIAVSWAQLCDTAGVEHGRCSW